MPFVFQRRPKRSMTARLAVASVGFVGALFYVKFGGSVSLSQPDTAALSQATTSAAAHASARGLESFQHLMSPELKETTAAAADFLARRFLLWACVNTYVVCQGYATETTSAMSVR